MSGTPTLTLISGLAFISISFVSLPASVGSGPVLILIIFVSSHSCYLGWLILSGEGWKSLVQA